MTEHTFLWHDFETFGINPRLDRPSQFACIRTDLQLNEIEAATILFCQPAADCLPQPDACLLTGITPQLAAEKGMDEYQFALRVHQQMMQPGTCSVGYNSIRFDDEVTRHLLYRNFLDPYAREYKHGNSRWDLIDVVRLMYATRPEGIKWPLRDNGAPSFKLEDLAAANGLSHEQAHDALFDVRATIDLARLIRSKQPRLFDYCLTLRNKQRALTLLKPGQTQPLVHVSSRFPAERGCLAIIAPICRHPVNASAMICLDLSVSPRQLEGLSVTDIQDRVFVASADLPDDVQRIPLKLVHANKSPILAPINVLKSVDQHRISLNLEQCISHFEQLRSMPDLTATMQSVFADTQDYSDQDVEERLYDGFLDRGDQSLLDRVHRVSPDQLSEIQATFSDLRYQTLMSRFRARHHPETLSEQEMVDWQQDVRDRLGAGPDSRLAQFRARLDQLRLTESSQEGQIMVQQLSDWGDQIARRFSIDEGDALM